MVRHKSATTHTTHHTTTHRTTHKAGTSAKRGHSHSSKNTSVILKGILTSFNPTNYTAGVLLLEATSTFLQNVPIAYHMDGTSALVNNLCAVLLFDEQNYTDGLIIGIYPNVNQGAPNYSPGRVTIIPQATILNSVTITNGSTGTYTITGSNNVPSNALGILVAAYFTSTSTATYIQFGAHGGSAALTIGNLYTANGFVNGDGIVPVDGSGKIDIKAFAGDCVITVYIYGYII